MRYVQAHRRLLSRWGTAIAWVARHAPWLLLPVLITQGAQHVAEIWLGMFDSRAAFIAQQNDALRWVFGYAKVAGLLISLLLVARAVALGSARRAIVPQWRPALVFVGLFALTFALDAAFRSGPLRAIAPDPLLQGVNFLLQLMLLVPLLAALFEDDCATLRRAGWRIAAALVAIPMLAALPFVPMQWLHGQNHEWAFGAPTPLVCALMLFDTLWIGLLTLSAGSGIAIGWRSFVGARDLPPADGLQPI